MLNMHPYFEIERDERRLKPSYSFSKNPLNPGIQRHNSIQKNNVVQPKSNAAQPIICSIKDLKAEMGDNFDIKKTKLIQSDEYKEWEALINKYNKDRKQIKIDWEKTEDGLAAKFESDQNKLIEEYQRKDDILAAQFDADQTEMLKIFEKKIKELDKQHEINKTTLWAKYKPT